MNKKRIVPFRAAAVMLACVTALSACSSGGGGAQTSSGSGASSEAGEVKVAATGFPIVNKPITLKVFGSRDANQTKWDSMFVLQEYEKKTGIKMDYEDIPATSFAEKLNLLFASNDTDNMPDILLRCGLTPQQISMYGSVSKQIVPMNKYIDQYAPNLKTLMDGDGTIKPAITSPDGNIYTLPNIDTSDSGKINFKQWINKDWLAKLNLSVPTTTDELTKVLTAFRDGDPNGNGKKDEIPLGIRDIASVYELGGSFGLDYQMGNTVNINDNKVHFWLTDDKFKEYLQFLNSLYKQKLLWQDYYKGNLDNWRSNLSNAKFGAFYMPYSDVFVNVEVQFEGFKPLKGPDGDQMWSSARSNVYGIGNFSITSTNKYPEASMRWIDYSYSKEGSVFFRYGEKGKTYHIDSDGKPVINNDILNDPQGFMTALGKINMVPGGGFPGLIDNDTDGVVATQKTKDISKSMIPYVSKKIYSVPLFDQNTATQVNTITQDLYKYRDDSVTKFIIGEWGFDKWDEYCSTLNKIGLSKLTEYYQTAFDHMNAVK